MNQALRNCIQDVLSHIETTVFAEKNFVVALNGGDELRNGYQVVFTMKHHNRQSGLLIFEDFSRASQSVEFAALNFHFDEAHVLAAQNVVEFLRVYCDSPEFVRFAVQNKLCPSRARRRS